MKSYIPNSVIEESKSYWATHFCSLLECLHYHTQLQHNASHLPQYPSWSLSDMRGNLPNNFFYMLKNHIYNWGFQYFIVNFLNQKSGSMIVEKLIEELSNSYNIKFSNNLTCYYFYISGYDSKLSIDLESRFSEIFPRKVGLALPVIPDVIKNSDICLVLKDSVENINVGIFGEVEGHKGHKLKWESFWRNKSDYCVFAIGVIKSECNGCYLDVFNDLNAPKVNLYFEAKHFVVDDFRQAVDYIEQLFLSGPKTMLHIKDEELGFFVDYIKNNWNKPVIELIGFIKKFINFNDYVGKIDGRLPFVTSIQAD